MVRFFDNLKLFFQLIRITVTIPVSILGLIGYYAFSKNIDLNLITASLAIFFLAAAASVINQLMEKKFDILMSRTQNRPIPSGKIKPMTAIGISFLLIIAGIILISLNRWICLVLAIFNLFWYLGVYTILKRYTAFAIIPGALTGTIPLLIGWTAAGGFIADPKIILLVFYIFTCQLPHFWLLMLIYGQDYQMAGYPTLFRIFNEKMIRLWTMIWILSASIVSMWFINFDMVRNWYFEILILIFNLIIITFSLSKLIYNPGPRYYKLLFHILNISMLCILILASISSK